MGVLEFLTNNLPQYDGVKTPNQFAEISVVLSWENWAKECGPKSKNIEIILRCFETAGDFLSRISRWTMER
jgi:hypothetical protein